MRNVEKDFENLTYEELAVFLALCEISVHQGTRGECVVDDDQLKKYVEEFILGIPRVKILEKIEDIARQ